MHRERSLPAFTSSTFTAPSGSTHTVFQQKIDWDLPINTRDGVKTNLDLASEGKNPFVLKMVAILNSICITPSRMLLDRFLNCQWIRIRRMVGQARFTLICQGSIHIIQLIAMCLNWIEKPIGSRERRLKKRYSFK